MKLFLITFASLALTQPSFGYTAKINVRYCKTNFVHGCQTISNQRVAELLEDHGYTETEENAEKIIDIKLNNGCFFMGTCRTGMISEHASITITDVKSGRIDRKEHVMGNVWPKTSKSLLPALIDTLSISIQ